MRALLLIWLLSLFLFRPDSFADDKIVVTATRNETSTSDLPFSVNTIDGDRWEKSGGEIEKSLSTIPGLAFSANGGAGQTRSLFIRGSEAKHTLVLIDGIPVND